MEAPESALPMSITTFDNDDPGYLAWLTTNPEGYVVNIQRSLNPSTARLHEAGCHTISGRPPRGGAWTGPYLKVCSDSLFELENWASKKTGSTIQACGTCQPAEPGLSHPAGPSKKSKGLDAGLPLSEPPVDFVVKTSSRTVEVGSDRRLQFNNKPETVRLKSAIAKVVAKLKAGPDEILSAVFTSASRSLVDCENVLLYNVGPANFRAAAIHGLRFERVFASPSETQHHHCYTLVPRDSPSRHWRRGKTQIGLQAVPLLAFNEMSKPDAIWQAVRQRAATTPLHQGNYGLSVTLATPKPIRLASLVKPLLDGIICGLHAHDGSDLDQLAPRLAARMGQPEELLRHLLTTPAEGVLGKRRLLARFGDGLKWNPGDDECVCCALLSNVNSRAETWLLDFELFEVESNYVQA